MAEANIAPEKSPRSLPATTAKVLAVGLLLYLLGLAAYALTSYATTKSKLLTYGLSDATANLLGLIVMLVALGLPAMALLRIAFWRPKLVDYLAALLLPTLSWGVAQIPAKFDAVTGQALQYCAPRPDGTTFCLDRAGVDPLTQRKLVAVDSRTAEDQFRRDKDLLPRRVTTPVVQIAFFDALTGDPRIWVSKNDSGCYDIFNNPGVNPQTGERLEPVTRTIVQAIHRCAPKQTQASSAPSSPAPAPPVGEARVQSPSTQRIPRAVLPVAPQPREVVDEARRERESQASADRRRADAQVELQRKQAAVLSTRQQREAEARFSHQQRLAEVNKELQLAMTAASEYARTPEGARAATVNGFFQADGDPQVVANARAKHALQKSQADTKLQSQLSEIQTDFQSAMNDIQRAANLLAVSEQGTGQVYFSCKESTVATCYFKLFLFDGTQRNVTMKGGTGGEIRGVRDGDKFCFTVDQGVPNEGTCNRLPITHITY